MKTSKYYLIGFTAIVVGLMCCGPVSAEYVSVYDFDGLTAGAPLWEQDIWRHGNNTIDVETEANAKGMYTEAEQLRWTGFDGNVAKVNISTDGTYHTSENNYNGSPWSLSIPSGVTEVRFSHTAFARSNHSILVGLRLEDYTHVVRIGIDPSGSRWRLRAGSAGTSTYSTVAAPASVRTSYRLTAVLDYTDPTKVTADMLVEDLTAGTAAVEVISDIDLGLSGDQLAPSNLSRFYLRPSDYASIDNLTVTAIPEPSTLVGLIGLGLLGFAVWRRR